MKKLTLLLFFLFICPCNVYSQSVTLDKGKEFEIETITVDNTNASHESKLFTFYFRVEGKEGVNTVLNCSLVRAVTTATSTMAPQINDFLNTDSIRNFRLNRYWTLLPLTLLQQQFKVTISPKGELLSIDGIEDIIRNAGKKWVLADNVIDELKNDSKEFPKNVIKNIFPVLPEQTIGYQSEWTSNNIDYKITAINGAWLYLSSHSVNVWGKTINGTGIFNQVTGLIEQQHTQSADNENNASVFSSYDQKLSYGAPRYNIDTAWLNMAIRTNYPVSGFFRTNDGFDSIKVIQYLKANDPVFKNDPVYAVARLNLIQQSNGHDNYNSYGQALRNTPTPLLKGNNMHLFNKFGESINLSADSAFEVCKYLYKTYSFQELVQNSYAQSFLEWNFEDLQKNEDFKKYVEEKKLTEADVKKMFDDMQKQRQLQALHGNELLKLLHADKDPLMQQKINPLYLWVTAKADTKNVKLLNKVSNSFSRMSDAEMEEGNGGRYALLVYKLLLKAKEERRADKLLLQIISKLERYTNDTLNKNRYADQNILTYAYYLKYDAEKNIDTIAALRYLSKAAHYSPAESKEKAYASFYDRVFLNSEESYRQQFIEKLFSAGGKAQILQLLAEQISAEPQKVDEMQQLYQLHYPKDNFKEFLQTNVFATWKPAPVFTLKGIDGKDHSLSDFKNKWLVIDFWGT